MLVEVALEVGEMHVARGRGGHGRAQAPEILQELVEPEPGKGRRTGQSQHGFLGRSGSAEGRDSTADGARLPTRRGSSRNRTAGNNAQRPPVQAGRWSATATSPGAQPSTPASAARASGGGIIGFREVQRDHVPQPAVSSAASSAAAWSLDRWPRSPPTRRFRAAEYGPAASIATSWLHSSASASQPCRLAMTCAVTLPRSVTMPSRTHRR
jgi:hypothetical protein